VADDVQKLAPGARIAIGHGQMPDGELEDVMSRFIRREVDILVSTTIIESGIDIPTANTMIINNADRFGLAELHQLRGRVGRYKHRAYCYMLLPGDRPVTEIAARRLRAIEEFSMLGAGFKIAMRDLEIRGAGNLLGAEQSGHIAAVGYDMYCRLLDEAARELRHETTIEPSSTTIEIGLTGSLPRPYIPSDTRRLEAYRRIATARTADELRQVHEDITQAYGEPPEAGQRLIDLAALRIGAHEHGIRAITVYEHDVILRCESPAPAVAALEGVQGTVRPISLKPGDELHEVYFRPPGAYLEPATLLRILLKRFAS
jgi:transcription-repair coupling factor (superfamily II helicase)